MCPFLSLSMLSKRREYEFWLKSFDLNKFSLNSLVSFILYNYVSKFYDYDITYLIKAPKNLNWIENRALSLEGV